MITENLSTLKIHKLTQAQYDRELAAGNLDPTAMYLTPDEAPDTTLSIDGRPADAKAVGEALANLAAAAKEIYAQNDEPQDAQEGALWIDLDSEGLSDDKNIVVAPSVAKVGQAIVVKAVDENGKPTDWTTMDMPSGDEWELFSEINITEEVGSLDIGSCEDVANEFRDKHYQEVTLQITYIQPTTTVSWLRIGVNNYNGGETGNVSNALRTKETTYVTVNIRRITGSKYQYTCSEGGTYAEKFGISSCNIMNSSATLVPYVCFIRIAQALGAGSVIKIWGRK
jgi:hypothetical protein